MRRPRPRTLAISTERDRRGLTVGERALVSAVFGDSIALDQVWLNRRKWWMFQPAWITMAPDGHLWFHPNGTSWCDDFGCAGQTLQGHFVHEMVHVWQHQSGINLRLKRLPFARYSYLPLVPGKHFRRYGLEQQAEIVRDAFMVAQGYQMPGRPPLSTYAKLIPFWAGGAAAVHVQNLS